MESPCLTCTTKQKCVGSRGILRSKAHVVGPAEPGPCEPFNDYVAFLKNKNKPVPEVQNYGSQKLT